MENSNGIEISDGKSAIATVEHVESTSLYLLNKAEIDSQIATAHAFPRSLDRFKKMATEMATLDVETASSCIYRRPVGKDATGKQTFAEGKSIRLAEIVGASYGNLRVGASIVDQSPRQVVARGFAHDLETNFAATSECVESTVKRNGQPYDERMRIVIAKVALAKARRDATFMVVPGALCKTVEIAARETALGKGQTMEQRRTGALSWIQKLAIPIDRVWTALGVSGIDDCGIEELTTLKGIATAIKDNEITIEEAFPDPKKKETSAADKELERFQSLVEDAVSLEELNSYAEQADSQEKKDLLEKRRSELTEPAPQELPDQIIAEIATAETMQNLNAIWTEYTAFHENAEFISLINKRKVAIGKSLIGKTTKA